MNCSITKKIGFLFIALMMTCAGGAYAQCGFAANQSSGCQGFRLNIQDTTNGAGNTASWVATLPAGSTPATITTTNSNQFSLNTGQAGIVPGVVCITMTDTINGQVCHTSQNCNFNIYPNPKLSGSFSTDVTCTGACVYWNDASTAGTGCSPLHYLISWGQSPIDTVPGICRKYTLGGTYSPAIVLTNSCGCSVDTTFTAAIRVIAPPSASFTGTNLSSCTSPFVSTMTAGSAANALYSWYISTTGTFSATPTQSSNSNVFSYSYTYGTYNIKLVVEDTTTGCTDSLTRTGYVSAGPDPAACFTISAPRNCGGNVSFCPCSTGGTEYLWNFTGGSNGSQSVATVTNFASTCVSDYYYAPGVYSAQLIVFYPGGCSDTLTKTDSIHVGQIYSIGFTTTDTFACTLPQNICVTYTGQSCPSCTFVWEPPNNTPNPPSGPNIGHNGTCYNITSYGQYSPQLTVTDTVGCSASLVKTNYFSVEPIRALVNIQFEHGNACALDTIVVSNSASTGGPFTTTWSFPGANIISQNNVQTVLTYPGTGCNHFSMIVQNQAGCRDTLIDSICISPKPIVSMTVTPHDICYEAKCNTFTVTIPPPGGDTATSVIVWPEGNIYTGGPRFTINKANFDSLCYMYQDYGAFAFCYLADDNGCYGDTTCLTASGDSVYIFPPIAQLQPIATCRQTDTILYINKSEGADSTVWTFQGVSYPNKDTLPVVFPRCGVNYALSITAFNDTTGCMLTKTDSVFLPCYETAFRFVATKGCYQNYCDTALIYFTGANALQPTSTFWSVQPTGATPQFNGYSGDTIPCYPIYGTGAFDACVQLTYANGCKDTLCKSKYISISYPEPSFSVSDTAGCVPFCVNFTNTSYVNSGAIKKWIWSFGDSVGVVDSVDFSPSHCFNYTGQFLVCLTIVDTNGCSREFCLQIQADLIHADFTETDSITCIKNASPLNPITYTSSSTGIVSAYQWILPTALGPSPGGNPGDVNTITEQYTVQGYDSIGMVAIDQYGVCRDTVWKPLHVANPIANYGLPNLNDTFFPCPPAVINPFTDSSLNGICSYRWNFGDGTPEDTAQNPAHIWTIPGTYPITEVVTTCHGCIDSNTKYTIVIGGPIVTMTSKLQGGCPCFYDTFYIKSINSDSLQFTSGGGIPLFENLHVVPGTAANPTIDTISVEYCQVGDIKPSIVAIGPNSCEVFFDSLITPIPVDTPTVAFSYTLMGCGTDSVCFTNLTTFTATYARDSIHIWTFGDGTTDTTFSPCHRFPAPGNYTVKLVVKDQVLCSDSTSWRIHVPSAPLVAFGVSDSIGCSPFTVQFSDSSVIDDSTSIVSGYWNFGDGTRANYNTNTSDTYFGGTDTVTLVITDGYGCTDSAKHTIQTQGALSVTIGPNQTICLGDTATLSGSGSSTLRWLNDYNISDTNSATPKVWPQVDTCYILRVGSFSGCYIYDTVCISISTITLTQDTATTACKGQVTNFTAAAQTTFATITGYSWRFGDGSAAGSGQATTHIYAAFGSYTDTVIVTNSLGCKDTALHAVTILDAPHAAFTLSLDTVCPGTQITATNTSTAGASGALSVFTFNVPQPLGSGSSPDIFSATTVGNDTVILIQTDVNQCADTVSQIVDVFVPPASYNIDTTICPGATITLQAIGSATVLWTPNYDISNVNSATPQVYPADDTTYIARVGALASCYIYDTVNVTLSTMTASATADSACLGLLNTYTGTATAVNATISSYTWKFGDGSSGTGQTTTHQYAAYGTYNDVLIATSSRGCKDTAYGTVTVFDKPHAALSVSVDSVCLGGPVTVANLSTAGASGALTTSYFNVGFPPPLTTGTATFTPVAAGTDQIILVQTDANGCVDSAIGSVLVHNLPAANFNNGPACTDVANPFTSSSTQGDGPITTYSWFINGASVGGNSSSITDSFSTAGTVPVCLQVTDIFGCTDSLCQNIMVFSVPPDTVSPLVTTICAGYSASFTITGLPPLGTVQWVPSTWVSNPTDTDVTITPLQTVQYLVYSYYLQCIPKVDTVTINVIDSVPVSASASPERIVLGLSSTVTPTIKGTIDSIVWSPDSTLNCSNCMSPVATPHETTTYTATIYYSQNGVVCSNTATVTVTVFTSCNSSLIYVPNTFTPNGDHTDDVFRLLGQGISVVDYFRVYDRWGKKVFEADNVDDASTAAWNGGYNNNMDKPENTGVFMYEFQIQCVTGQTVTGKGNVTLLR